MGQYGRATVPGEEPFVQELTFAISESAFGRNMKYSCPALLRKLSRKGNKRTLK
jgi:hypothetical protein